MWFGECSTPVAGRLGPGPQTGPGQAFWLALALGSFTGWAAAAEPTPPTLTVSGAAILTTETRAAGEGYEVRAALADEVGRPIPGAELRARLSSADGGGSLFRCGDSRGEGSAELLVSSDASGRACLSIKGATAGALELSFADARGYFERTSRSVRLPESATEAFEIGFDPPLSSLSLDQPLQQIGILAKARPGVPVPEASELVLSMLADGSERELSRMALDSLGELHRLSLVSSSFGSPGPARLIVRLRGRGGEERAIASVAVLRTATVGLQLASALEEGIDPGGTLHVAAASALGPVPGGVIEARSRELSVAAARVQKGQATLTLPAMAPKLLGKTLTLDYVGDGPGWLSGPSLEIAVKPPGRSYGRYALWFAAAVLTALAVVLGWRRPPRLRPGSTTLPPRGRASVEVIESLGPGGGYRGTVCDAHEGTPISPAALSFIAPGSAGHALLQVRTAADGSFNVTTPAFPSGTLLEVSAPFHATLTAPLPGPGVLQLSLLSRRRALLDRLVHWAERRGKPWIRPSGDPTPGHVAGVAEQESEATVGQWARAVERLAYGPNAPDAAAEQASGVVEDPKLGRD